MTEITHIEHDCNPGKELAALPLPDDVQRVTVRWRCSVCGQRWECTVAKTHHNPRVIYMQEGIRIGGPSRAWVAEQQRLMKSKPEEIEDIYSD